MLLKGVADLADVRGGQRVGGHHAGDQALVVEFLCRYVPLSATIGRLVPACAPFFRVYRGGYPNSRTAEW